MKTFFLCLLLISPVSFSQTYSLQLLIGQDTDVNLKVNNISLGEIKPSTNLINITEFVNKLDKDNVYKPYFVIEVQNKESTNYTTNIHKQIWCAINVFKDKEKIAQNVQNVIFISPNTRTNINYSCFFVDK